MLDIKRIKAEKEKVETALSKKMEICSLDDIVELDDERIKLQQSLDELQELRNRSSKEISRLKNNNEDTSELISKMKEMGKKKKKKKKNNKKDTRK